MTYPETQWVLQHKQAEESRSLKKLALFVGLSLIAIPVVQTLAYLLLGVPLEQAEAVMDASVVDRLLYYGLYVGFYCLMLLAPVGVLALIFRRPPTLSAEHRRPLQPLHALLLLLFGMAFCILANYLTNYWLIFVSQFGIEPFYGAYNNDGGLLSLALNLFTYAVLPGLVEELVFRGWILGSLAPFGERRALLLSALIFGLIHGNLTQVPFAFVLGLLFGYIFLRTGRLWPGMMLHFLNNAMSVGLDYLSANMGLSENAYMLLQMGLFVGLIAAGTVAGLLLYTHRTARELTRPLTDRRSVVPAARRARLMWLNPAVIVGMAGLVLITILAEVAV